MLWLTYKTSPSPRRAWIEILLHPAVLRQLAVALPTEGVDRNPYSLYRTPVK